MKKVFINLKLAWWLNFSLNRSWIDEKILVYVVKMWQTLHLTTLIRTVALIFDEIRSLCKWKLELMKVMRCLNRGWIHNSYHCLINWSTLEGKSRGENSGSPDHHIHHEVGNHKPEHVLRKIHYCTFKQIFSHRPQIMVFMHPEIHKWPFLDVLHLTLYSSYQ